jgi:hypothetical protein
MKSEKFYSINFLMALKRITKSMLTQNWLNKSGPLLFSNKSLALAGLFCFVTVFSGCDLYSQRIFSKPLVRVEEQALECPRVFKTARAEA